MTDNPFTTLGLPVTTRMSDDDVRAAWRRIAAATHPDREDGGDPARFGVAAAAYVQLRTAFGRGEAVADLGGEPASPGGAGGRGRHGRRGGAHRARAARPDVTARASGRDAGRRVGAARERWLGAALKRPPKAGRRWWRPARPPGTAGRGLAVLVGWAAAVAAGCAAAVGLTPATIGLLAGALTVAGWALWRQGGLGG